MQFIIIYKPGILRPYTIHLLVFVDSLGFSVYTIMSSERQFYYFFPICRPFIACPCLIILARTSITI